ncbi:hypothetical protein GZ77_24345 [Endozoicomonas montiporae]|uniref:Uncharacterized protein n=2 Tax=Endozoicomonas montiporae TaxID=1027273 RepID=A0A081MZM7_9GAMM|nr:hypothetical protein [Endozoicomonas montiporae]AMO54663.1 hypothetical protein EZMO1_0411 [Endozoicomonas montiporae CL-33]KEQ11650.1 hypothetical protein GZ77_24345 [Endozoicomonas montiporae]
MSETTQPCARIVSVLNVEDEAMRAFYNSLTHDQSVEDYISARHLHFASQTVEGVFLYHLLALTELALDHCSSAS